jgi:hypothetical protein
MDADDWLKSIEKKL